MNDEFSSKQIKLGNTRLLRLAVYVERRQRAKPTKPYDQRKLEHDCGAPACLIGHARVLFPNFASASDFFGLTWLERAFLFSEWGCDNADRNWRKAVAYVRTFVAKREAALAVSK